VVGVDGSDHSILAVDFDFAHTALHGLSIVAIHAYQRPAYARAIGPLPGRGRAPVRCRIS
jgi:hypothetical protein